jgi:hypothetical protein
MIRIHVFKRSILFWNLNKSRNAIWRKGDFTMMRVCGTVTIVNKEHLGQWWDPSNVTISTIISADQGRIETEASNQASDTCVLGRVSGAMMALRKWPIPRPRTVRT